MTVKVESPNPIQLLMDQIITCLYYINYFFEDCTKHGFDNNCCQHRMSGTMTF